MNIFAYILVILSGATGLIYQVLWQKQLSNLFGSHQLATSLVLATFFGFMALGYHLLGRGVSTSKLNRIWVYGLLEGGIGIYALISPFWFYSLTKYYEFVIHWPGSNVWGPILFAMLLMGLPTFLMGGTIPVLVEGLSQTFDVSHKTHSRIYGLNTLGAFLGTTICGFFLLEKFGIQKTLFISGVLNLLIWLATLKFKNIRHKILNSNVAESAKASPKKILYTVSFLSGFYVFGLENLIIRMAGISIGSSVYTYSMIVGCFIFAIAIGAVVASRLNKFPPLRLLWTINVALVVSTLALYHTVPFWPEWLHRIRFAIQQVPMNFGPYWFLVFLFVLLILFIPVALMGMNLPLLFYYLRSQKQFLGQTVGRLYAINAIGCVLGAFVGGYVLFFWLSGPSVFKIMIFAMLASVFLLSMAPEAKALKKTIWLSTGLLALFTLISPAWNPQNFSPGLYGTQTQAPASGNFTEWLKTMRSQFDPIVFEKYDENNLVAVTKKDDRVELYVNGRSDSSTSRDFMVRGLNMIIPILLSPKIENIFIVGLGGGLSLGISTSVPEVQHVEVAELSKGVIDSLPYFSKYDFNVLDRAQKFTIHHDDAFNVLKRSNKKFDVIVSEPSTLWVTGVEKLLSIEFLERAKASLTSEGVYAQWLPIFAISPETTVSILKNFNEVFPWTTLWVTSGGTTLILASQQPLVANSTQLQSRFLANKELLNRFEMHTPYSVLGRQLLSPMYTRLLTSGVKVTHTLGNPVVSFQSARVKDNGGPFVHFQNLLMARFSAPPPQSDSELDFLSDSNGISLIKVFYADKFYFA